MTYHAVCHECGWEILETAQRDAERRVTIHRVGQQHDNVEYAKID